jgi:hypothetical protein
LATSLICYSAQAIPVTLEVRKVTGRSSEGHSNSSWTGRFNSNRSDKVVKTYLDFSVDITVAFCMSIQPWQNLVELGRTGLSEKLHQANVLLALTFITYI